jgi:hypothetical protein
MNWKSTFLADTTSEIAEIDLLENIEIEWSRSA